MIRPTQSMDRRKGCSIWVVLANLVTAYVVLVLPAALGTLAFLHRALDFYERIERRKHRRVPGGGRGIPVAVRRSRRR